MRFWPLTGCEFDSPISFRDGGAGARAVERVALAMVARLTALLLWRFRHGWARADFAGRAAAELLPRVMLRPVL